MKRYAPVLWLLARTQRTCRTLRQELSDQRVRNAILEGLLGRAERERDQARRDCALVAQMAKEPRDAWAFLGDMHRIDGLDETGEVA